MRIISYFRVSTLRQGASGLGIEAQQAAVAAHVREAEIVGEFIEIESGRRNDRPKLFEALALAKKTKAVLVIAKLDRLARDVHFISGLMKSGVEFIACDMPSANKLTVHILAAVAENEAEMISARTKAALGAAKARGTILGGDRGKLAKARAMASQAAQERAQNVMMKIAKIRASGTSSLRGIAAELNDRNILAPRGGSWSASTVSRVIARAA